MIKVIKLKPILAVLAIILISGMLTLGIVVVTKAEDTPYLPYTIVLDAGHGARDAGCSGVNTGAEEKTINLEIVKKLKTMLKDFGFNVVLTREDDSALYDENAESYKLSDMEKRVEIINQAKPDFVISIHCNSYPNSHQRGAQAFYQEKDESSQVLASAIQECLLTQIDTARNEANFGDYYILNQSPCSAVLIECGYLTNPEDETLLLSSDYQQKIAYSITCGLMKFFDLAKADN